MGLHAPEFLGKLFGGSKKPEEGQQITNPNQPPVPHSEIVAANDAIWAPKESTFPTGQQMGQQLKERTPGYQSPPTSATNAELAAQLPNVEPPPPITTTAAPPSAETAPAPAPTPIRPGVEVQAATTPVKKVA